MRWTLGRTTRRPRRRTIFWIPRIFAAEYGNSITNVPNRLVVGGIVTAPWKYTGWKAYLLNDYEVSPSLQLQSGLPYSIGTSGTLTTGYTASGSTLNAIGGGVNGSAGTARMPGFERNGFEQPRTIVLDLRLSKRFSVDERVKLEFLGEAFNVANHQNVTGVNMTAYTVGSVSATKTNTLDVHDRCSDFWRYDRSPTRAGSRLLRGRSSLACGRSSSALIIQRLI